MKKLFKILGIIVGVLILGFIALVIMAPTDEVVEVKRDGSNKKVEEERKPEDKVYQVGDVIKINGVELSVISAKFTNPQQYVEPTKGKVLTLEVEVVNNSDTQAFVDNTEFNLYDKEGNGLEQYYGYDEEGRLNGIKESNDFRNYLKELKSRAAKAGKSVSLDSIIDDDGRLIQPNNPIWEEKMKKYRDAAIEAEQKFGINSVEHLIALSNKAKFIDMTTIHQLKPITVQDEDGNDVTIEYSTYIINLERSLLGLKKEIMVFLKNLLNIKDLIVEYEIF